MARSKAPLHALGAADAAGSRGRRVYSDAFKADAVAQARAAQSIAQVARELGVARNTLTSWMEAAAPVPAGLAEAVRSGDRKAYLEAMRDELAEKIAGGVSAKDLSPLARLLDDFMKQLDEIAAREAEEAADADDAPDEDLDPDSL